MQMPRKKKWVGTGMTPKQSEVFYVLSLFSILSSCGRYVPDQKKARSASWHII